MSQLNVKLSLLLSTILVMPMIKASEITQPVHALFDAMRAHDAVKLQAQFTESAILQRAVADGSVTTGDLAKFAENVATSTKLLDEQLLSIEVQQNGNLATVWTPFAFYLDKKLSHCGVNSFQLVKNTDGWKINYLIDNVYFICLNIGN